MAAQLRQLEKDARAWGEMSFQKALALFKLLGEKVATDARKRVPVETGNLRNAILSNTFIVANNIVTEVGTNVREYPIYLEFGTELIAGGAVKAIGDDAHITDAQAVTSWAALAERGGSNQQMPWLRPAWTVNIGWFVAKLNDAFDPPKQKRGGRAG